MKDRWGIEKIEEIFGDRTFFFDGKRIRQAPDKALLAQVTFQTIPGGLEAIMKLEARISKDGEDICIVYLKIYDPYSGSNPDSCRNRMDWQREFDSPYDIELFLESLRPEVVAQMVFLVDKGNEYQYGVDRLRGLVPALAAWFIEDVRLIAEKGEVIKRKLRSNLVLPDMECFATA